MTYEFANEFNMKLKHDFKQYVLLTSKTIHWREEFIMEAIYGLSGYKCHKTVKYEKNSSHIHVKFEEEYMAKEAVDFLINLNSDLTVVLVEDMLREWYDFEKTCGLMMTCSITVVDIIGHPPFGLNFLTETILHSVFRDFHNPYVLPYTSALNAPHVQVVFGSMTEALAACITFGEWWIKDRKMDSFCFRVRINPSEIETFLIGYSGGTPEEAFKLDYFVNLRNESVPTADEQYAKQQSSHNFFRYKGLKEFQKPEFATMNIDPNQNRQSVTNGNLICVPIIAPFNSYAQSLLASNKFMKADAASNPNFQSTQTNRSSDEVFYPSSTQSENTMDCHSSGPSLNPEELNKSCVSSEGTSSDLSLMSVKNIQEKPDVIPPVVPMKQRRNCKKPHLKVHGRR